MEKTQKDKFAFGENWQNFLTILTDEHIREAQKSLGEFLGEENLEGKYFLDVGSGSGLHSLAARNMGAFVHSFDYDSKSVACTQELKHRYFPNEEKWIIESGSILDLEFVKNLGKFDICYAWGVLHHTGFLWQALYNVQYPVAQNGLLFVAIYNDQGIISAIWKIIKRIYCHNWLGQVCMISIFYPLFFFSGLFVDILHFRNPLRRYQDHKKYRGMSLLHDWRDWLGGYPFEPAQPDKIISFYKNLGFDLVHLKPTGHGFGNNQFLFRRTSTSV